jgi:hypothetical protein
VELYCHAAASPVGVTPDAKYELLENLAHVLNTVDMVGGVNDETKEL